jgi:hypothetical protein
MARRRRYELTDEQFGRIEDALPEVDGRGQPYEDHRKVLNGIFRADGSGAPGGTCRSGMVRGGGPMTDYVGGPKMALLSRLPGSSKESSTLRAISTGSSWVRTAKRFEPAARWLRDRPTIKRRTNRPRRQRSESGTRI